MSNDAKPVSPSITKLRTTEILVATPSYQFVSVAVCFLTSLSAFDFQLFFGECNQVFVGDSGTTAAATGFGGGGHGPIY